MSRDFTDWESSLMHYGVPGMKKGVHKAKKPTYYAWDTPEDKNNNQKAYTKELIKEKQASNQREINISGKAIPQIYTDKAGPGKDRQFMQEHNIPSAYLTKYGRVTTKKPEKPTLKETLSNTNLNPQHIINKRRGKLLKK